MSEDGGCKVDVVTDTYGLGPPGDRYRSLDDYLLARWTGADGRDPVGYRTLADDFNRRVLEQVYADHGREVLAARLESDLETLTGDDGLRRGELVDALAADGVDADRLRRDLISWGTMANHLKQCLDGEKPQNTAETDWERRSIAIATDRAEVKIEEAVSALATKGQLPTNAEVALQVQLGCAECQARVPFSIALDRGYICEAHAPEA